MNQQLSPREMEVAEAFWQFDGDNDKMAEALGISPLTTKQHVHRVYYLLGFSTNDGRSRVSAVKLTKWLALNIWQLQEVLGSV